jgi:hypothetical protein
MKTSEFKSGMHEGRKWMWNILQSPVASRATSILDEKRWQLCQDGKELSEWQSGFLHGATEVLRIRTVKP